MLRNLLITSGIFNFPSARNEFGRTASWVNIRFVKFGDFVKFFLILLAISGLQNELLKHGILLEIFLVESCFNTLNCKIKYLKLKVKSSILIFRCFVKMLCCWIFFSFRSFSNVITTSSAIS